MLYRWRLNGSWSRCRSLSCRSFGLLLAVGNNTAKGLDFSLQRFILRPQGFNFTLELCHLSLEVGRIFGGESRRADKTDNDNAYENCKER